MIKIDDLSETQIKSVLSQFDSFCKTVIRNEARNIDDSIKRKAQHEYRYEQSSDTRVSADHYAVLDNIIETKAGEISIENVAIYDCLVSLPAHQREALLLQICNNWTDAQIALQFGVTARTIRKWRKLSILHMRKMLAKERGRVEADH